MSKLVHIADRVLNRPLMLLPDKLALVAQVLDGRIGIDASDLPEIEAEHLKNGPDASRFVGSFQLADPMDPKSVKPYRTSERGVAMAAAASVPTISPSFSMATMSRARIARFATERRIGFSGNSWGITVSQDPRDEMKVGFLEFRIR